MRRALSLSSTAKIQQSIVFLLSTTNFPSSATTPQHRKAFTKRRTGLGLIECSELFNLLYASTVSSSGPQRRHLGARLLNCMRITSKISTTSPSFMTKSTSSLHLHLVINNSNRLLFHFNLDPARGKCPTTSTNLTQQDLCETFHHKASSSSKILHLSICRFGSQLSCSPAELYSLIISRSAALSLLVTL